MLLAWGTSPTVNITIQFQKELLPTQLEEKECDVIFSEGRLLHEVVQVILT